MKTNIFIPTKINVGFQERKDTYTSKLAYVIYFDEKGKLNILVYEEKLKSKAGRPVGHDFDYFKVEQMKADGMTNKEIYTELGISKALYYLRMKEYKK